MMVTHLLPSSNFYHILPLPDSTKHLLPFYGESWSNHKRNSTPCHLHIHPPIPPASVLRPFAFPSVTLEEQPMTTRSIRPILYIMSHPFPPTQGHLDPLDLMHHSFLSSLSPVPIAYKHARIAPILHTHTHLLKSTFPSSYYPTYSFSFIAKCLKEFLVLCDLHFHSSHAL